MNIRFKSVFLFSILLSLSGCSLLELPDCNSAEAKQTLKEAFDGSQFARQLHLSAVEVSGVQAKNGSSVERRLCSATIALNNLEMVSVDYSLESRESGEYMLEFVVTE